MKRFRVRPQPLFTNDEEGIPLAWVVCLYLSLCVVAIVIGLALGTKTTATAVDASTRLDRVDTTVDVCLTLIEDDYTRVCWNGDDYCEYPLELGGVGGRVANSLDDVRAYLNGNYTLVPETGCWRIALVNATRQQVRVGRPRTYMVLDVVGVVVSLPFLPTQGVRNNHHHIDVDWGDGTPMQHYSGASALRTHVYGDDGGRLHTIRIGGTARCLCYSEHGSRGTLAAIQQWGSVVTYEMNFYDELHRGPLVINASDAPNPSLVVIDNLFGVSAAMNSRAMYASRFLKQASWALPNIVTAVNAFAGLNVSALVADDLRAIVPPTLVAGTRSMFAYTVLPRVSLLGCTLSSPIRMFAGAQFTGALQIVDTSVVGDATQMFHGSEFVGRASFAGFDGDTIVNAAMMFADARFSGTATDLSTFSLPNARNVFGLFYGARDVPNMPVLGLDRASNCNVVMARATLVERFEPAWPLALCTRALHAFAGAAFAMGADLRNLGVARVTVGNGMFERAAFGSGSASANYYPGVFTSLTDASHMFDSSTSSTDVDLDARQLAIPAATTTVCMFCNVNRVVAMPALRPESVVDATNMFRFATLAQPLDADAWTFPALVRAPSMFVGANFASFPMYVHNWGMTRMDSIDNMFNGATNLPVDTMDVSAWKPRELKYVVGFFTGTSARVTIDVSGWGPCHRLASLAHTFAGSNVVVVGIKRKT